MSYEFHPEAEQELYEAALRYESEVPELGHHIASISDSNETDRRSVPCGPNRRLSDPKPKTSDGAEAYRRHRSCRSIDVAVEQKTRRSPRSSVPVRRALNVRVRG